MEVELEKLKFRGILVFFRNYLQTFLILFKAYDILKHGLTYSGLKCLFLCLNKELRAFAAIENLQLCQWSFYKLKEIEIK